MKSFVDTNARVLIYHRKWLSFVIIGNFVMISIILNFILRSRADNMSFLRYTFIAKMINREHSILILSSKR